MYITIYPFDKSTIEVVDTINAYINEYKQCTRYIDMFLGDGLIFNNLTRTFDNYILSDSNSYRLNFYRLLREQRTDYFVSLIEEVWNTCNISNLTQDFLVESDFYTKIVDFYVLQNKTVDKDLLLSYFPKKELTYVSDKLKSNKIEFRESKIGDICRETNILDLLFINLDIVKEEYHRRIIKYSLYYNKAVTFIYSKIGCNYIQDNKYCSSSIRVNGTGYIFIYDNELPEGF